jgi:broad specificity phosphatase PhoE
MTRVWLVRHGASTAAPGVAIGWTDPALSAPGLAQARRVAATLAGRPLARIASSDLRRALSTAEVIAGPHRLPVESTAALREIDFGAWEGRSLGGLWSEQPEAAHAWERDLRATPASFGESLADLERRVRAYWESTPAPAAGGEVAVVAHRGSLAVLLALIAGGSLEAAFAAPFELGTATAIEAAWR